MEDFGDGLSAKAVSESKCLNAIVVSIKPRIERGLDGGGEESRRAVGWWS